MLSQRGPESNIKNSSIPFFLILLSMSLIFFLDINVSTGSSIWLLYFLPVLSLVWVNKIKTAVFIVVPLCILLIILDYFLGPQGIPKIFSFLNRLLGIIVLIIFASIIYYRRKTEEELIKQSHYAEELSDFNFYILESSPYGIATYNADGNCTYVNEAFHTLIGATRTQALSQNFHNIESWKKSGLYDLAIDSLKTGKKHEKELHIITTFGKEIWVDCRIITFTSGRKLNLLINFSDISAYKLAEKEVQKQKKKAEQIASISRALSEERLDYQSILKAAVKLINSVTKDCVSIRLISDDGIWIPAAAAYCGDEDILKVFEEMVNSIPQKTNEGITAEVIKTGKPFYINNLHADPDLIIKKPEYLPYIEKLKADSIMILPLIAHQQLTGVLAISRTDPNNPYSDAEQEFLLEIAERVALTIDNVKLYNDKLAEVEERKHAEEILLRTQVVLNQAEQLAHLGAWGIDFFDFENIYKNPLYWSNEVYRIFGYDPGSVKVTNDLFFSHVHPDDKKKVKTNFEEALLYQQGYNVEYRIIRTSGEERIVFEHADITYNENGQPLKIIGMVQDITDRKKAEEASRQSEQRFRQLADSMPQIVWTANPDGIVDYYNKKAYDFEGIYEIEEGNWHWEPVLHPDDVQETLDAWKYSLKTGEFYEIAHRIRTKDGTFKWFLSRGIPMRDERSNVIKWFGTATDIHEQKKIQEDLERTAKELERSNKELEQFAYTASHDLQEPVRMVKSYSELIDRKFRSTLNPNVVEFLGFINEGASRMQQLISDLLKYSRIMTQAKPFEKVDCNEIVNNVLADLRFKVQEENAVIEYDELPAIKGDRTQIRQLFQNLLQNAIKFRDERNPVIKIKYEKRKKMWLFSVSDNGIGIEPQHFERIFVIFQRLHEREKYQGTGIGLALCKKIVERHGGQIYVESDYGNGSTFYFTLPAINS